jgi:hypothetical protein
MLAEPETVARELVAFCVDEPLSDEPDRLAVVGDYLDGGHRHQAPVDDDVLSPAQSALDEALLGLSGPLAPFTAPTLVPETANLQLAFDEAKRLSFFLEETDRLSQRVEALEAEHERQVAALHAEIETRSAEASDLAEQVMLLRAEADDYLRQLEELRGKFPIRLMTKAKGLLDRG